MSKDEILEFIEDVNSGSLISQSAIKKKIEEDGASDYELGVHATHRSFHAVLQSLQFMVENLEFPKSHSWDGISALKSPYDCRCDKCMDEFIERIKELEDLFLKAKFQDKNPLAEKPSIDEMIGGIKQNERKTPPFNPNLSDRTPFPFPTRTICENPYIKHPKPDDPKPMFSIDRDLVYESNIGTTGITNPNLTLTDLCHHGNSQRLCKQCKEETLDTSNHIMD